MGVKAKKKTAKTRLDAYYRLAKDQGYRARSAFKLIQLNRKYDFLGKARVVVDLCAAPGGWCQVAAKYMPLGSTIVGVDLVPIAPIRGVKTFVGDITDDKTRRVILTHLQKKLADCVIHDGAPNVGGVWAKDLFAQNALVLSSAKLATAVLRPGGWFVTKVFRSQDFQKVLWVLKQLFHKVEATKPLASRMESAEIFVVCEGYKSPKHIDPAMFHAQNVFSDVGEERVMSVSGALVMPKSNVPMGYDGVSISHRVASLTDFLNASDPKAFLKAYHEIRIAPEESHLRRSRHSKREILYLCQDLPQVGEADRRRLLRWREQLQRERANLAGPADDADGGGLASDDDAENDADPADPARSDDGVDDARAIAVELLQLRAKTAKEAKRRQQKVVDRKLRRVRGLINFDPHGTAEERPGEAGEDAGEDGDWTMASVGIVPEEDMARAFDKHYVPPSSGNAPLNEVANVLYDEADDFDLGSAAGSETKEGLTRDDVVAVGNSMRIIKGREDDYDVDAYGNYVLVERRRPTAPQEEAAEDPATSRSRTATKSSEEKTAKWVQHHRQVETILSKTFPKPRGPSRRGGDEHVQMQRPEEAASVRSGASDASDISDDSETSAKVGGGRKGERMVPDAGKLRAAALNKENRREASRHAKRESRVGSKKSDTSFEIVRQAMTDPETRARTLAIATKMLDPSVRREIEGSSVHRFMFNDDDVPEWFEKDERRNCRIVLPVTAADIEDQRRRFLAVNARPGKAVMEAVQRKRRRAQRMLKKVLDKSKTDPRAREKAKGLTVRKLMRSKSIRGGPKKSSPKDRRTIGERRRQKQREKRQRSR